MIEFWPLVFSGTSQKHTIDILALYEVVRQTAFLHIQQAWCDISTNLKSCVCAPDKFESFHPGLVLIAKVLTAWCSTVFTSQLLTFFILFSILMLAFRVQWVFRAFFSFFLLKRKLLLLLEIQNNGWCLCWTEVNCRVRLWILHYEWPLLHYT